MLRRGLCPRVESRDTHTSPVGHTGPGPALRWRLTWPQPHPLAALRCQDEEPSCHEAQQPTEARAWEGRSSGSALWRALAGEWERRRSPGGKCSL